MPTRRNPYPSNSAAAVEAMRTSAKTARDDLAVAIKSYGYTAYAAAHPWVKGEEGAKVAFAAEQLGFAYNLVVQALDKLGE